MDNLYVNGIWTTASYLFLAGVIFFAAFFNAVLYLFRPLERVSGFLSVICFSFGLNLFLPNTTGLPLADIFPWLQGILVFRIDLFTLCIGTGFAGLMIRELFPLDISSKASGIWMLISAITAVSGLFLPEPAFRFLFRSYLIMIGLFCALCLLVTGKVIFLKRPDCVTVAAGIGVVSVAGIIDACAMLIIGRPFIYYLIPISLLVLTGVMSLIVVRRFTWSIIKSERLKEDLKQRIRQEQYFRTVHRRLSEMLDRIPIPVIAIDEDGGIVFANEQASKLFKTTPARLQGVSVDFLAKPLAEEPSPKPLSKLCFGFQSGSPKYVEVRIGANSRHVESGIAELAPLSLDDEDLTVLIFHSREDNIRADNTAGLLIEELNRNRLRLEKLGQIVNLENPLDNDAIRTDLEAIDTALDQISSVLKKTELNRRTIARNVMTLSLAYWEACTGQSKLDLARQSALWRIEVSPDGFERTRTLDRYLDVRTFPRMPRWKNVISTGDFVLAHCSGKTGMRRELEGAMSSLRLV